MLIDEIELTLKAGHGGPGRVSFLPGIHSGPDGGDGGRGGDVIIKVSSDASALNQLAGKVLMEAELGAMGGRNQKSGRAADPMYLYIPVGSVLIDQKTGEEIELTDLKQEVLICKGGLGGRGNASFKSARRTTPKFAQPGLPGEEKKLKIILKLIADFGLIGKPNAGKSSLLNELTRANAKVGAYPFTTLEPSLGVVNGKVLADIPGLIEGASSGKGLGISFLKHIEKVKLILHCIDITSEDLKAEYDTIRKELKEYDPEMLKKPEIILLTKSDLVQPEDLKPLLQKFKGKKVLPVSVYDFDSLKELKKLLQ